MNKYIKTFVNGKVKIIMCGLENNVKGIASLLFTSSHRSRECAVADVKLYLGVGWVKQEEPARPVRLTAGLGSRGEVIASSLPTIWGYVTLRYIC